MKKTKCSYCGANNHYSLTCYKKQLHDFHSKKKRPLRRESKKSFHNRDILSNTFFHDNPPDERGGYTCYLQISRKCPIWVSLREVTLEHILPKVKYPEVKYNVINIKPACTWCNGAKLSNTPYHLALIWPHIKILIETEEWKEWESSIVPFLKKPLPSFGT